MSGEAVGAVAADDTAASGLACLAPESKFLTSWRRSSSSGHVGLTIAVMWLLLGWAMKVYVATYHQFRLDEWQVGGWLVNYQGGFVRRGLVGELIYLLCADVVSVSPPSVVYVLQVATYVAIGAGLTALCLRKREWSLPWVILAPAGVLFVLYNRFADTPSPTPTYPGQLFDFVGGERIEILLMLSLVLLALAVGREARRTRLVWVAAGVALYVVTILAWEPAALFLPVVVVLVGAGLRGFDRVLVVRVQAGVCGVAAVELLASVLNPGNATVAAAVCHSLARFQIPPTFCQDGEISQLANTSSQAFATVQTHWPSYALYALSLLVCLVPFVWNGWLRRHRVFATVSFLAMLPLFFVGTDYGRWIHLFIFAITIHWLVVDTAPATAVRSNRFFWARDLALLAWIGVWTLPYTYWPFGFSGLDTLLFHAVR